MPTGELNRFIEKITSAAPPVTASRRNMRVMYAAQAAVGAVESGRSTDLVGAMLSSQQASLSFSMLLQVRNKVVQAYQEVMRMSI